MLETPTPPPADFGLGQPLAQSTDENLYLSASARWNHCRDQWLALMAQNPQAPLTADWWQARARGTDRSRQAQAIGLYRQHFEASCQWAFARGTLNAEQLNVLLDLINPTAQAVTPEILVYVETLSLRADSGVTVELPGALVITRNTDQPVTQMLYWPSRPVPWMTFESRNDLERWLIQQQPQLETRRVTVDYTVLDKPELPKSTESL
ncbi:hypothetical protein C4E44_22340, partial [Pseudomonas sp. MWU12-2312b]